MRCHNSEEDVVSVPEDELKILLMGNPNVGKSVIFSKLTGREVLAANFAGTTVTFTTGKVGFQEKQATLIDVPGTYSLEAASPAEEIAVKLLHESADAILCVLDATNLERNLNLALQLKQQNIPVVFALNLTDVAERKGIVIDERELEKKLGSPVIPTVAIRNLGLNLLLRKVWEVADSKIVSSEIACSGSEDALLSQDERWQRIGKIAEEVQKIEHRHSTFWEKLGDATLHPFPGLPIAFLALVAALGLVVGGGQALRSLILLPLINDGIVPLITSGVHAVIPEGIFRNILVGEYGMLVKGIEWPFALILPYVFLFYITLSLLEDSGYMPRLGVLLDTLMRRAGIQGGNIVPLIMGYGCAVPAILGTRAATSQKERFMVTAMVCLAVPCSSQTAAFIALLGEHSMLALLAVYLISFVAIMTTGMVLNKVLPGKSSLMLLEIPNLLKPDAGALLKKIGMRIRQFAVDAALPIVLGVGLAALIAETGVLDAISVYAEPLVVGWLGLPAEASLGLLLGIVRRELAVLPLLELDLTTLQLMVGSVVALFYLPCLSVVAVLVKEFGLKVAVAIAFFTLFTAFFVAGLINQVVSLVAGVFF